MATVSEIVPESLQPEAEAASPWLNRADADPRHGPPDRNLT
jgi:hypothetical protein